MAVEQGMFQNLQPCRYVSFHYPNPCYPPKFHHQNSNNDDGDVDNDSDYDMEGEFLRVTVLDSPHPHQHCTTKTVAMLVPQGREEDWLFSSEPGHCQLLNSAQASRLVLIARKPSEKGGLSAMQKPNGEYAEIQLQKGLAPLLLALSPRCAFEGGLPSVPFVSYTDNVIRRVTLEKMRGALVGMMLVEDVELVLKQTEEGLQEHSWSTEWRRRLRFERMPNLIQTEIALLPKNRRKSYGKASRKRKRKAKRGPDLNRLVHPYLPPIVAGLVLVAPTLEECLKIGKRPNLLCIGVGGGALLMFLSRHFEFRIVGVEMDEVVLNLAKKYFGLVEDEHLHIDLGDGVEVVESIAQQVICSRLVPDELARAWQDILSSSPKPKEFNRHHDLYQGVEGPGNCNRGQDQGIKRPRNPNPKDFNLEHGVDQGTRGSSSSNPKNINPDHGLDEGTKEPGAANSYILHTNRKETSEACDLGSYMSKEDITLDLDINAKNENIMRVQRRGLDNVNEADPRVHVIVIDVDAGDARIGLSAPPSEFHEKRFLLAARIVLHDHGILAINVVPSSKHFYNDLISAFREVFLELYEIEVNNGENYVLFASPLRIACDGTDSAIAHRVKHVISRSYMEKIRKL